MYVSVHSVALVLRELYAHSIDDCGMRSGGRMTDYRLYLLTSGDRIARHIALACDDDEHAIAEMSLHIVAAEGAELWRGARLVRRVPPSPGLKPHAGQGPLSPSGDGPLPTRCEREPSGYGHTGARGS